MTFSVSKVKQRSWGQAVKDHPNNMKLKLIHFCSEAGTRCPRSSASKLWNVQMSWKGHGTIMEWPQAFQLSQLSPTRVTDTGGHIWRGHVLGCWHAFDPLQIIQVRIPTGNFWSIGTWNTSSLSEPRDGKKNECVGNTSSFSFWQRLFELSGGTCPQGKLLMYYYHSNVESWQNVSVCQTVVWWLHPSLPGRREVDLIQSDFFPPLSVSLSGFLSSFFVHLSAAKHGEGKKRCDGVGCLWMRFKHREHFQ